MRVKSKKPEIVEGDLTPMIDMTFQLIAFFMVLINFSQTEANERVQLPSSELARPPEGEIESPIIIHVAADGTAIIGAEEISVDTMRPILNREISVLKSSGKTAEDANIIIRAHKDAATGKAQEIISVCQEVGFENFLLRAKEEVL
ncbi:Biopolymer transport protein ExbD [Rosistilla carotiformis]|uniref:Biopolymer transport protein ExbD n=1 Tax=Rosistilla carotiformis TaxID=2528017 RepID=A0A518JND5_9BACT|nr:biopolymer transporter ExbD [Rosistilla carotiformis]QDV67031.1 Biopolymer transport protein ExbD [Rosistilla carotiformis]